MAYNNSANYQVTQYDVITGGANNLLNNVSLGTAGNFFVSNGVSAQPTFQSPGVSTSMGTSASPSGTTSTTYVNMGLGSSWKLTPKNYGNVNINITGCLSGLNVGSLLLCYGTGSAPSNGTAATGTTVGLPLNLTVNASVSLVGSPFSKGYIITGLTPGTAYWFDVQLKTVSSSATLYNVTFIAQELIS